MSKHNIVLVSEEHAPADFSCIWENEINRTIDNVKTKKATEKLYFYKIQNMYGITEKDFVRLLTEKDIFDMEECYGQKFSHDLVNFNVQDKVKMVNIMAPQDDVCSLYNNQTGTIIKKTFYIGKLAYLIRFDNPIAFGSKIVVEDILLPNELQLIA